jgi:hypothetical protein
MRARPSVRVTAAAQITPKPLRNRQASTDAILLHLIRRKAGRKKLSGFRETQFLDG